MTERLDLTAREVTHLILVAAMLNDRIIGEIQDKAVQATVLKIQGVAKYYDGVIETPRWKIVR